MDPNHLPVDDSSAYHYALDQCVDHWGLVLEKTSLIRDGINHVYGSETRDGAPVIVRISNGAVRTRAELSGELLWLAHLRKNGCTVTNPIASRRDELLETIELDDAVLHVACFERFPGKHLEKTSTDQWNDDLLLDLGRQIGRIHRMSDAFQLPPDKDRKQWYEIDETTFPDPLPSAYNREVVEIMQAFLNNIRQRPAQPRHYGLVHRDLHAGNFLVDAGKIEIIDFDLGCYGWRTMDFATLLFARYYFPSISVPDASPKTAGKCLALLVQGYREEYTLDDQQLETVADMILIHSTLNYVIVRPAIEHWQSAISECKSSVAESMTWLEQLWLHGHPLELDLSEV
ncbi:phosphotransferase enzyme family protein [Bremerella alba]|uniref:Stress response kinase A n=1 Tax=Bremerella alba TaxID=980252 RepID=A0A7V9A6A0_9BACT|nr:phosphotransferase [Bremerella alba]MBA2113721.1 Stress response kinase A [Bremerella alba]